MKVLAEPFSEGPEAFSLESCEEGLDFLAYVIREDLAVGRATSRVELEETRAIAMELLAHAAKGLARLLAEALQSAADLIRSTRQLDGPKAPVLPN